MNDDFNTAKALTQFFELIRIGNEAITKKSSKETLRKILETVTELGGVLGLFKKLEKHEKNDLIDEIERLIQERNLARKNREWKKADEIRERLKKMGIVLRDYPEGTIWIRE